MGRLPTQTAYEAIRKLRPSFLRLGLPGAIYFVTTINLPPVTVAAVIVRLPVRSAGS